MRPTPKGERLFADGASVREDPERRTRVATPYVVISGNQGAAIAVNSPSASQTVTNRDSFQAARDVARLIERSLATAPDSAAQEGREIVDAIDGELAEDVPEPGKLKQLLFRAGTALAGAFGVEAGTEIARLAMDAHSLF